MNGQPVHTGNDLVNPIMTTPIGNRVKLAYMRDRSQHDATLTVEDRTKTFPDRAGRSEDTAPGESGPVEFGLRVEDLTQERSRRLGMEGQRGVLVTQVEPASFAEDIGFFRGDLIVAINHDAVSSVSDYRRVVAGLKAGQEVVFKVLRRQDSEQILTVFLPGVIPADSRQ